MSEWADGAFEKYDLPEYDEFFREFDPKVRCGEATEDAF